MTDLPAPSVRRASPLILGLAAFALAASLALVTGWGLSHLVETRTREVLSLHLMAAGDDWATVTTDGLIVNLSGTAPSEAARFSAVALLGKTVDPGRIRSDLDVTPPKVIAPPQFSVEILRNDDEVQLIGLLPDGPGKAALSSAAGEIQSRGPSVDMLETAAYPAPPGWDDALAFGTAALKMLPRSKISVQAGQVTVTATSASDLEKRRFEAALSKATPPGLKVVTAISAPRPVLTPFTLRFVLDEKGARFDACSADTELARNRILKAATEAGVTGAPSCTIGMGVPSPSWAEATARAIAAVKAMGGGTVTFSDADITLLAGAGVSQAAFDAAVGDLRAGLPDVFSLDARMPEKAAAATPAVFEATLDGKTHRADLHGPLVNDRMAAAVASLAKALFGADKVYLATLPDASMPDGWTERVFAGLDALAVLDSGKVTVKADTVEVEGVSGQKTASDRISQLLSQKLGQGQTFRVDVSYDKALDPMAGLPTPQECLDRANAVMAKGKIDFDPGKAELAPDAAAILDALAAAFKNCGPVKVEISGHTDAQGSAEGNLKLSAGRAQAVLAALQSRLVDVSGMKAVGYGETRPIADNSTDAGREANRRIEFALLEGGATPPDATAATQTTQDQTPANQTPADLLAHQPAALTPGDLGAGDATALPPPPAHMPRPKLRP